MPPPLIEQECFPDAVHFRARLRGQWGQHVEQQPDTWHGLGAGDGKVVPKGSLQAEGLLGQLPALKHTPSSPLQATASQRAREAGPARCHQVCLLHKAKVRLRLRHRHRGSQGWHSPSLTSRKDLTHNKHCGAITGAQTYILTPIRSQRMSQIYSAIATNITLLK